MTGIAVPLRYEMQREEGAPGGFDPEDFDVTCFGMRVALPSPAHRCCGADALAKRTNVPVSRGPIVL